MEKRCTNCKETKPLTDFYKSKSTKDGHAYYCKVCNRIRTRQWEQANPEHVKARREAYYAGGREITPKTETPKYRAVHMRLLAIKGKATAYDCVGCGGSAKHWAYSNDCKDELKGQNGKSQTAYCVHPEHYQPMCVPCHKAYDIGSWKYTVTTA